ncbi:MAG TPA: DegT/DnrJ/EryC1/StrS family aminotransferase [Cyclobacteriaceae bacterium]|jgi:dTDP-4-amino-4,6-dideoxygalactose transaminase|nr:DegT/DnrJ/EryC1/StrS family aminotransferase [Cyclobacteriaceae bacterium]
MRMLDIPFLNLAGQHDQVHEQIARAINDVIASDRFVLDKHLAIFEKGYASYIGTNWCCGVGNGLDAIYLSLLALGVGENDEVIVPTNTSIATWLAVTRTGAKVIPVEPSRDTHNIDLKNIEQVISSTTKAIVPVHLYGRACDMTQIMSIAEKHHLKVVEDNAQAIGAEWKGRKTGSIGHCNASSFYPTKNLGAIGDGGAITTNSNELREQVMMLRNYGSKTKYVHEHLGINSRLDEMQAAILSIKLNYLHTWNQQRIDVAAVYTEKLGGVGDLVLPLPAEGLSHVYHLYVVQTKRRDHLQQYLLHHGIETLIHYPVPPHLQKAYGFYGYTRGRFPITEELASTCLSLPLWVGISEQSIHAVCKKIEDFF